MNRFRGAIALLPIVLCVCVASTGAQQSGFHPLKSAELLRRGATLAMIRSFLELGQFYLAHDRPDRARQILTYGLLHDPTNVELLSGAATACVRLHQLADALEFAAEAARLSPDSERLLALAEVRRLLSASAASSPPRTSTTGKEATSAPAAAVSEKSSDKATGATTAPRTGQLASKMKAWHLAAALEGAIKGYNAGKTKKERMTKLDLGKLKVEHFLPEKFELSGFSTKVSTDGKVTVEGYGTVPELETAVSTYARATADVSRILAQGALSEATYRLQEMKKQFPDEPEVTDRLLFALREQHLWDDALKVVEQELARTPRSAQLAYLHAMLLMQAGRLEQGVAESRRLAGRPDAGVRGILARELVRLAQGGTPPELERDLPALLAAPPTPTSTGTSGGRHEPSK